MQKYGVYRMVTKKLKLKYLHNGTIIKRYDLRVGKWGAYFFDTKSNVSMDLDIVLSKLNRLELRTKQLHWYVDKYGEVPRG